MAITFQDDTADPLQTEFAFNFPYLEDEHVTVFVDGVQKTLTTDFTIQTSPAKKVILNTPATGGEIVRVRRISAPAVDLVDFVNGSVLTESELDRAYLHNRYLAEESSEQNDVSMRLTAGAVGWDGLTKRILNIVDPVNEQDVATKNYVDGVIGDVALGEVPDDSITYAKIQDAVANNVLLGNDNGAGEEIQELNATEVRAMLNVADGATANTGTVTIISSGAGLTGGPITTSGTLSLDSIENLTALGNVSGVDATPTAIAIKDEDNMASDSATALATQQSIKAYVDAQALSKWDSGWISQDDQLSPVSVGSGATMILDHDLGSAAVGAVFSQYAAESDAGLNMEAQMFVYFEGTTGSGFSRGIQIKSITSTQITVQLGTAGYQVNTSGAYGSKSWGTSAGQFSHIRVVLVA